MQQLKFIFKKEKQEIIKKLNYYGISEVPYLLVELGKEKIRGYSGSLSIEELNKLNKETGIEIIGLYLFHNYPSDIRISFDAVHALKPQITKNILEINDEQTKEFLEGKDIILSNQDKEKLKNETRGFKIIKYKEDIIGTGKLTQEGRIVNYMPKERRLR